MHVPDEARRSLLGPRRFGRRNRGARGGGQDASRLEMAPQPIEKTESGLGNGMGSEAANLQDVVYRSAADRLASRKGWRQLERSRREIFRPATR